jgi:DNA-binding GntR family transcriptional regulator
MHEEAQRLVTSAAPPLSLRDRAYLEIKRRINRLEYRPGAYLNEAQISRQLKVGRTPAHQALDRLMLEGLIQVIPRKGVVVQSISLDEVIHILELRLVNEPYCVGLAVERATPQEITRMRGTSRLCRPTDPGARSGKTDESRPRFASPDFACRAQSDSRRHAHLAARALPAVLVHLIRRRPSIAPRRRRASQHPRSMRAI